MRNTAFTDFNFAIPLIHNFFFFFLNIMFHAKFHEKKTRADFVFHPIRILRNRGWSNTTTSYRWMSWSRTHYFCWATSSRSWDEANHGARARPVSRSWRGRRWPSIGPPRPGYLRPMIQTWAMVYHSYWIKKEGKIEICLKNLNFSDHKTVGPLFWSAPFAPLWMWMHAFIS